MRPDLNSQVSEKPGAIQMVGFRNIAVHDYQALQLPIVIAVITRHLVDFTEYSRQMLLKEGQ